MRKIILSLALIFLMSGISCAQDFSFGVIIKPGMSQITRSVNVDTSSEFQFKNKFRFSFQAGIFSNYHFSDRSSVGAEFLFLQQNGLYLTTATTDSNAGNPGGTNKFYMHTSWLSLPLYYTYAPGNISLHGGIQGNFLIASNGKEISDAIDNGDTIHSENNSSTLNFKKFDIGFAAGLRYDFTDRFFMGLDYYIGFVNLIRQDGVNVGNAQNQNLSVGIGFRIVSSSQNKNEF